MFGISFLNPAFLIASVAALIPLLIHLLTRRRVPRIPFSHLAFLWQVSRQRRRRLNLEKLLLLVLRILAVLALVAAFARPTIRGELAGLLRSGARSSVCVLLDASLSMRAETERGTLFDEARDRARELLAGLTAGDEVSVILFDDAPRPLFAEPTRDLELVSRALDEAEPTWGGSDLKRALAGAYGVLEKSRRPNREIYVLSDFQEPALSGETEPVWNEEAGRSPSLFFLPVIPGEVSNVSVDEVHLPILLARPGETVKISAALSNHSATERTFPLRLRLDGEMRAEVEVTMPPEGRIVRDFFVTLPRAGELEGEVVKRSDLLSGDDRRHFLLPVADEIRVLVLRGRDRMSAFYLSRALDPSGEGGSDVRVRERPAPAFSTEDLRGVDVVAVPDPTALTRAQLEELKAFAERGGGLALFLEDPGAETGREEALLSLLPGLALEGRRELGSGFVTLDHMRERHPLFAPFREEELEGLLAARFSRYAVVRRDPPVPPLVSFPDGTPAIQELDIGRGKVILFSFGLDLDKGNFALTPMFVPLMHQMAYVLSPGGEGERPEDARVGSRLEWALDAGEVPEGLGVETPSGERVTPRLETRQGHLLASVDETSLPGFYTLLRDSLPLGRRVVNPSPEESRTAYLDDDRVGELLGVGAAASVGPGRNIASVVEEYREGREVYQWVVLAAMLLLFAELLVGRGRERSGA
jgi:hypothetical protein